MSNLDSWFEQWQSCTDVDMVMFGGDADENINE